MAVFFGDDESDEFTVWGTVSKGFDNIVFYHVFNDALAAEYDVEGTGVVLYKQFDEGVNTFEGEFTSEDILAFISDNYLPTILPFDQNAA